MKSMSSICGCEEDDGEIKKSDKHYVGLSQHDGEIKKLNKYIAINYIRATRNTAIEESNNDNKKSNQKNPDLRCQ